MSMLTESLITLAKPALALGESLVKDIPADRFGRLARGDVEANHPAWLIGHLSIYPTKAMQLLGEDTEAHSKASSDAWESLFNKDSECLDDPDGTRYPPKDEIVDAWLSESRRVIAKLPDVADSALDAPQPVERWKQRMPRIYDSFAFLMGPHAMFHLGQLSTWRRAEGLGSVM